MVANGIAAAQPTGDGIDPGRPSSWLSRNERERFLHRSTILAMAIFFSDVLLYSLATALAMAPLHPLANVFFSIWSGLFIGKLFTIGHDGCHQSYTPYRNLNTWLARIAFLPSAHSASLWTLSHNQIHHRYTNLKGGEYVWEPWSPEEYASATAFRRGVYRLYRSRVGPLPYYLVEMWWKKLFLTLPPEARREWRKHVFDALFLIALYPAFVAGLLWLGTSLAPERPLWQTAILGWALPFLIWNWLMGLVIYAHHTHPEVAWFDNRDEWTFHRAQVLSTIHARLPQPLHFLSNNIMEHTAHHVMPAIPLYRLEDAQAILRRLFPAVRYVRLSRDYGAIVRACKLFDFKKRRWVGFDGNPTGPAIPLDGFHSKPAPATNSPRLLPLEENFQ